MTKKKSISYKKSFASHPKAKDWSDKNDVKPENIYKFSHKKFFFDCSDCGHEFKTSLDIISSDRNGCDYCKNYKLCDDISCVYCAEQSLASHPKANEWSDKNKISARNVCKSTKKKYVLTCEQCKHDYNTVLNSNHGCPFCSNHRLCDNNCISCNKKSFASHPFANKWSNKNKTKPRNVFLSTHKKYFFDCDNCDHVYEKALYSLRTEKNGCPFCGNFKLCQNLNCIICFNRSYASHLNAHKWSIKNKIKPRHVFKKSSKKYFFDCDICKHSYKQAIHSDANCSYCSNTSLCNESNCDYCKNNSFALHPKAKYWSDKNKLKPRQVFKSSGKFFSFDCDNCGELYKSTTASITSGSWCSCTINKTETKLFKFLKLKYNISIDTQKTFNWCKSKRCLPFDFFIKEYNLIIELDGIQHFKNLPHWKSKFKEVQQNDNYKTKLANKHGYSVIRIFQESVWLDKNNWENNLKNAIKKYDKVTNVYIGDIYDTYDKII